MKAIDPRRVRSGSHGSCWLNGELAAEVYKLQFKGKKNKETIPRCGEFVEGSKTMSIKLTGTIGLYNASSRMIEAEGDALKKGKDTRFTIVSKLDDPDADSVQRIQINGVSFDDLTLADWEAAKIGKIECPFTADGYEILET